MKTNMKSLLGFLIIIGVMSLLIIDIQESSAETITVAKTGGDYEKIQDAIDNATEGDTIRVYEGTYEENVKVEKQLILVGNGSEETTIDSKGSGSVVDIEADGVNISGFNIINGSRGISVYSKHNIIKNNTLCELLPPKGGSVKVLKCLFNL